MNRIILALLVTFSLSRLKASEALDSKPSQFSFDCNKFSVFTKKGVPAIPLRQALYFYSNYKDKYNLNSDRILIADYSLNSSKNRFFILNLKTDEVIKMRVSHGSGKLTLYRMDKNGHEEMYVERFNGESGHNGDFTKCRISDEDLDRVNLNRKQFGRPPYHNQENLTRAGFFKTGALYNSYTHHKENRPPGREYWHNIKGDFNGIRLFGLTPEANDKAFEHGVVFHEATYNSPHAPIMGRSYGCPAFSKGKVKKYLDQFLGGVLYYSYTPQCQEEMTRVEKQIPQFEKFCESYH